MLCKKDIKIDKNDDKEKLKTKQREYEDKGKFLAKRRLLVFYYFTILLRIIVRVNNII